MGSCCQSETRNTGELEPSMSSQYFYGSQNSKQLNPNVSSAGAGGREFEHDDSNQIGPNSSNAQSHNHHHHQHQQQQQRDPTAFRQLRKELSEIRECEMEQSTFQMQMSQASAIKSTTSPRKRENSNIDILDKTLQTMAANQPLFVAPAATAAAAAAAPPTAASVISSPIPHTEDAAVI